MDPETGEIIASKGDILDRRNLDQIIPNLENGVGFRTLRPTDGVMEDSVLVQSIKIYAPNDEEKKSTSSVTRISKKT